MRFPRPRREPLAVALIAVAFGAVFLWGIELGSRTADTPLRVLGFVLIIGGVCRIWHLLLRR